MEVLAIKLEEYLIKSIEEISMVEFLPITSERLVDLRRKNLNLTKVFSSLNISSRLVGQKPKKKSHQQ